MASIQSLYSIRDLIAPIANITFFVELSDSGRNYSDEELANIIKADNYAKTKKKVADFTAREEQKLEDFRQQTVLAKQAELEDAQHTADSNRPGSGPSGLFLDQTDRNAVARHNEKVQEYNNRLKLYERLIDQRDRAKERYEDSVEKYKERESQAEEKIHEKMEELKPALDQDMAAFLGKLQQLVFDCFHNKALIFETFVLLFMAKKAYVFLYDRIESNSDRNSASNTFRQLNGELESLVEKHVDDLKHGFSEIVGYVYDCFKENEEILDAIQKQLEQLPYDVCRDNDSSAHSLASLSVDTNFQYRDIIDPTELARMEGRIQDRREHFVSNIAEIEAFTNNLASTFNAIAEVLADSKDKHQNICQNKEDKLGEAFDYSRFVLGIFDEEVQDEYLKQQKVLLEAMQLEIETSLGTNLPKLLKTILETELLSISAAKTIENDPGFAFLGYRQKIQKKRQEFLDGAKTLDRQLQEIARQPHEKSEEFTKKIQTLLGISVVPIGNLGALFPLHQETTKFLPALSSGHPVYSELRETIKGKLQVFCIAHAVIAVLIGGSAIAVGNDQKPIALGAAGAYGVSAGLLFLKKKQLSDL